MRTRPCWATPITQPGDSVEAYWRKTESTRPSSEACAASRDTTVTSSRMPKDERIMGANVSRERSPRKREGPAFVVAYTHESPARSARAAPRGSRGPHPCFRAGSGYGHHHDAPHLRIGRIRPPALRAGAMDRKRHGLYDGRTIGSSRRRVRHRARKNGPPG